MERVQQIHYEYEAWLAKDEWTEDGSIDVAE